MRPPSLVVGEVALVVTRVVDLFVVVARLAEDDTEDAFPVDLAAELEAGAKVLDLSVEGVAAGPAALEVDDEGAALGRDDDEGVDEDEVGGLKKANRLCCPAGGAEFLGGILGDSLDGRGGRKSVKCEAAKVLGSKSDTLISIGSDPRLLFGLKELFPIQENYKF